MCLEDIRIMRKSTSGEHTKTITTTSSLFISPDKDRISLVIGAPETNEVVLSMNSPAAVGSGIRLQAGGNPLILTLMANGDMVTKGFYAIAVANTEAITYFSTSFKDTEEQ